MRGGRTRRPPQVALRDRRTGPELAGGRPRRHGVPQPGRKRFVRPGGAPSFKKTTPAGRIPTPARLARASSSCRAWSAQVRRLVRPQYLCSRPRRRQRQVVDGDGRRGLLLARAGRGRRRAAPPPSGTSERLTKTNARRPEQHVVRAGTSARTTAASTPSTRPTGASCGPTRRDRSSNRRRPWRATAPCTLGVTTTTCSIAAPTISLTYVAATPRPRPRRRRDTGAPRRERAGLFATTRPPRRYALNPDGSLKWRAQTLSWVESSPSVGDDGVVYVGSDDSYLYAINPDDGSVEWQFATSCAPARVSLDVRRVLGTLRGRGGAASARYGRATTRLRIRARGILGLSVRGRGGAATRLLYPSARGPRTLRARPRRGRDSSLISAREGSSDSPRAAAAAPRLLVFRARGVLGLSAPRLVSIRAGGEQSARRRSSPTAPSTSGATRPTSGRSTATAAS